MRKGVRESAQHAKILNVSRTDYQFYGVPEVRFKNNLGFFGVTDLILKDGFTYTFVQYDTGFLALM